MDAGWEQALRLKMEQRSLNFCALERRRAGPPPVAAASSVDMLEDSEELGRKKAARDPMSHRIIEKRRRDRMNNCLADLSRLIPAVYLKKGRGRIEKTEIIEMAIKHLRHLQAHSCKDPTTCEVAQRVDTDHQLQYRLGFQECLSETARFLVDLDGAGDDMCLRLVAHLQKHFDKISGAGPCFPSGLMLSDEDTPTEPEPLLERLQTNNADRQPKQEPATPHPENSCSSSSSCSSVSQLREMLQNPGLSVQEVMRRSDYLLTKPAPVTPAPSSEETYKFKNDIKDRFHKDAQWGSGGLDRSSTPAEERRHSHTQGPLAPAPSPTRLTVSAPPPELPPEAPPGSPAPPGVAAFALHPRGAFYIPVTLDPTLVGPAFACIDDSPSPLHPVSISVHFGRQRMLGPPPWSQCPWRLRSGEPNGYA
ncbi:hairy/E(spl)-related with YRPW motif isoform X2 [Haemaphysalis longicornis]